ncbi:MAG: CBS domain-containing protein, partial [Chloroflexota bacterium]
MITSNDIFSDPILVFVLKDKLLETVSINLKPRAVDKIYWVATKDTTIQDAITKLLDNPLKSIFVIDEEGKVIGALTTNETIIENCKKKKPKGPKPIPKGPNQCRKRCEEDCKDRGGCGLVIADAWGACMFKCKDDMDTTEFDQKLEVL